MFTESRLNEWLAQYNDSGPSPPATTPSTNPPAQANAARPYRDLTPDELYFAHVKAHLTDAEIVALQNAWQHMDDLRPEPHFVKTFPSWFNVLYAFGKQVHLGTFGPRPLANDPGEIQEKNRVLMFLKIQRIGTCSMVKVRKPKNNDDEGANKKDVEAKDRDEDAMEE